MGPRSRSLVLSSTFAASLAVHAGIGAAIVVGGRAGVPREEADPAPQLAGDTFELPAPDMEAIPLANASPTPDLVANAPPAPEATGEDLLPPPPRPASRHMKKSDRASKPGRPSGGRAQAGEAEAASASAGEKMYGAVGDRSATNLGGAFAMSFAQATSSNPVWATAPLGHVGEATLVLELDEAGHLVSHRVEGNPGAALAAGIRATLTLIGQRPFLARGKITRLRLSGTITSSEPRDDMHGVYGIGRGDGHAYFSLPQGRKIDITIKER